MLTQTSSDHSPQDVSLLLIEDNPGDALLIQTILADPHGFRFNIVEASTLNEAKKVLSERRFDLVLSDLGLPDSQGLNTLKSLITKSAYVPIVVLTGHNDHDLGLRALELGAQDFLVKNDIEATMLIRSLVHAAARGRDAWQQTLSLNIMKVLNRPLNETVSINEILHLIREHTQCSTVSLQEGKPIDGKSGSDSLHFRSFVSNESGAHEYQTSATNALARIQAVAAELDSDELASNFTQQGSFWTGQASTLPESFADLTFAGCNAKGGCFESVALIPMNSDDVVLRVLQLCDERTNWFSEQDMVFLETLGSGIGVALNRQESQTLLSSALEQWQSTFNAILEPMLVVGGEFSIERCNQAFKDLVDDMAPEGKPLDSLIDGLDVETLHRAANHDQEVYLDRLDRCFLVRSFSLSSSFSAVDCTGVALLDVTEQKHLEESLAKQVEETTMELGASNRERESLATALEQSVVTIVITDIDANIEFINAAFTQMTGYSHQEVIGKNCSLLQARGVLPPSHYEEMWKVLAAGDVWRGVFCNRKKNGELYWEEATISPIRDENGAIVQFVGVKQDITSRKAAEKRLEEMASFTELNPSPTFSVSRDGTLLLANRPAREFLGDPSLKTGPLPRSTPREILDALEELRDTKGSTQCEVERDDKAMLLTLITDETTEDIYVYGADISVQKATERNLHAAKDQAEAATVAKSDFLANMSHEIRTPLNAIIGMGHLMKRTALNAQQSDYLHKMQASAALLQNTIGDILDFSKIEAGALELDLVEIHLEDILRDVGNVTASLAHEKGLELLYDYPMLPCRVVGDPVQLAQIINNLVGNAIKFTETGSIMVRAVTVVQGDEQVTIRFSVTDTGIGISEENQKKLFSAFTQAEASTTRRFGGTGLGLSICKRLVEMMGGTIEVDSEPGRGSTFSFTIDMELGREYTVTWPKGLPPKESLRAIVATENDLIAETLISTLKVVASDIQRIEGSAIVPAFDCGSDDKHETVVLLDCFIPDAKVFDQCRKIKMTGGDDAPKVIVCSAYRLSDLDFSTDLAYLDGFLVKPFSHMDLLETIALPFCDDSGSGVLRNTTVQFNKYLLDGAKILLVEDNEINQQVAQEMLEIAGASVVVACHGQEAVKRINEQPFDIVLMDVQMPVMDGYEATRQIRRNPHFESLPILAMTANALAGERNRALDAGMNDYISKPIEPSRLLNVLAKWYQPSTETMPGAPKNAPMNYLDMTSTRLGTMGLELSQAKGASALEREAFWQRVGTFLESYIDTPSEIRGCLAEGDHLEPQRLARHLRDNADTAGAVAVKQAANELETAIRTGMLHTTNRCLEALERKLNDLQAELQKLGSIKPAEPNEGSDQ